MTTVETPDDIAPRINTGSTSKKKPKFSDCTSSLTNALVSSPFSSSGFSVFSSWSFFSDESPPLSIEN